jgi:hypothetical protein
MHDFQSCILPIIKNKISLLFNLEKKHRILLFIRKMAEETETPRGRNHSDIKKTSPSEKAPSKTVLKP